MIRAYTPESAPRRREIQIIHIDDKAAPYAPSAPCCYLTSHCPRCVPSSYSPPPKRLDAASETGVQRISDDKKTKRPPRLENITRQPTSTGTGSRPRHCLYSAWTSFSSIQPHQAPGIHSLSPKCTPSLQSHQKGRSHTPCPLAKFCAASPRPLRRHLRLRPRPRPQ